jgi:hypothetical protein
VAGALLMAAPAVLATDAPYYVIPVMLSGYVLIVVATVKHKLSDARTALMLLVVSNASFWLFVGVWKLRFKLSLGPPEDVYPEVSAIVLWFFFFLPLVVYEVVVFTKAMALNRQRGLSLLGLVAAAAQVAGTVRFIYLGIIGL